MKYIDAEKLIAEIESIGLFPQKSADYNDGRDDMKMMVLDLIDSLQQEQPEQSELDSLMEEIKQYYSDNYSYITSDNPTLSILTNIARHFYELRNRALEEAARHVYESWMGGTMDDVRRDMAELGRIINARREGRL